MARRPTQFGTAQVKQKDPVRPLLVLLLIGAGGILLFLWLQSDSVDPVVALAEEPAAPDASEPETAATDMPRHRSEEADLENWWFDVESQLMDAFEALEAAKEGSCGDLENSVADLGAISPRREQPIQAPFSAIVSSLDRAVDGCRNGNKAIVEGGGRSARAQVKSLTKALTTYGIEPSTALSEN